MIRSSLASFLALALSAGIAAAQSPPDPNVPPGELTDLENQLQQLRSRKAEIEAHSEQLRRRIAELQSRLAEIEAQRAALMAPAASAAGSSARLRAAESRETQTMKKSPLLFPPEVERAMLRDGQPRLPRSLEANPLDLPRRLPPPAPRVQP